VQGERELASKNRSLGKIILKNLTPQIAGKTKIIVNFTISQDGILTVKAQDKENPQNEVILDLKPTYGLSLEEMTEMLYDSIEHSKDDMEARLYKEQQVTAEYLINLLQNALKTDKELLTTQELTQIEEAIYTLEVFITKNQDIHPIKSIKTTDTSFRTHFQYFCRKKDDKLNTNIITRTKSRRYNQKTITKL
jgi:molecular chaperone HscA